MTIIASIAVFMLILMALTGILLYAKAKLTPGGKVTIDINGKKTLEVDAGDTILSTLSKHQLFLPSACGGGGTCAQCKCQVLEGGGEILPTEEPYFSKKEKDNNWRLGCQVKVKEDMKIQIPEEVFGIQKWECEVISNDNVATFIKEFVVKLPEGENLDFKPGGYIQLDVPETEVDFSKDLYNIGEEYKEDYDTFNAWDLKMVNEEPIFRAYSMANHPAEGNIIKLNVRIAFPPYDKEKGQFKDVNPGKASSYVFSRKPGDKVNVSGPYGEFFIKNTDREMVYIGGGAGMAPLRSHIFHLFHTLNTDRTVSFWYGGRSYKELFYIEDFEEIERKWDNFTFYTALSEPLPEDNWNGHTGFIHTVLYENYLKHLEEPEELEYYICGPPMMNAAALKMLDEMGIPDEMIDFDDFG